MATPTPKSQSPRQPKPVVEVVDPRWLLKALAVTLAVGAAFAYLAVCALIYQGGWQLMLHPSPSTAATPAIPFQALRFDSATTGTPRLAGWWIPAEDSAFSPRPRTILYLHDGTGSLATCTAKLELLHRANVDIFVFDYRGFGQSDAPHPTEARMAEDAAAALDYLLNTRHIPAAQLIPYGEGLGSVLAANLSATHPELRALIVDNPDPDAFSRATDSGKAHLLPMHLLLRERFDIAAALAATPTPKLLLADSPTSSSPASAARVAANQTLFRAVSGPKITVTFSTPHSEDAYLQSITRFLDEYAP